MKTTRQTTGPILRARGIQTMRTTAKPAKPSERRGPVLRQRGIQTFRSPR